ncbi:MAG: hypothetical protein J6Y85_01685 [Alphaproteobacteria bacterium]|nr:hypothetical protein [Alphaproteobacteria bacterium]
MKNVEEMSIEEAIAEFSEILIEFRPKDQCTRFYELYNKIDTDLGFYIDAKDFFTSIEFRKYASNMVRSRLITNVFSGAFFNWVANCGDCTDYCICVNAENAICNDIKCSVKKKCAIYPLKKLQEELTDDILQKVINEHTAWLFEYLLINPRKDVVEWALKHKEELGLNKVERNFVEKYQVIPELRELIFNTLEVKEK